MPLEAYRSKRDFARTPEPAGDGPMGDGRRFTVQRHRATALHYDFRLEIDGVLVSWAVPKGPTLDPAEKRLAMRTEDHPIDYLDFEGVIPAKEYGGGDVIVWDWGTWEPEETRDPGAALRKGEVKFRLHGERLSGRFTIVRTSGRHGDTDDREKWLLMHKKDEAAVAGWDAEDHPTSVKSGRTNDEVKASVPARWDASAPAAEAEIDLSAAVDAPLPEFVPPMKATLGSGAFSDPEWLYEVKWDGYRVEAVVKSGEVHLFTRNRQDAGRYFPTLAEARGWIDAREAVVDGEVIAVDDRGRPDFSLLQDVSGLRGLHGQGSMGDRPRSSAEERAAIPIVYQAFDLLHLDGRSLVDVPLEHRKRLLRSVLRDHPMVRYGSHVVGDGEAFVEAAREQELEGVVAKLRRSPYEPGRRSKSWLKIKLRREREVVVAGWLAGQGSHAELGSLLVAVHDGDRLRHAGQGGSGLDPRTRRELRAQLDALARDDSPLDPVPRLKGAHWVEPRIVVRVEFAEWTTDGLLRQAAFKGFEIGTAAGSVRQEKPIDTRRAAAAAERAAPAPRARRSPPRASAATDASDAVAALDAMTKEGSWTIFGREVRVTNLDKVLCPGRGEEPPVTKRDLFRYHAIVGPTLVPYLAGRGTTVQRFPNGVEAKGFWQKDLPGHTPEWIGRWTYHHREEGDKDYVVVEEPATLAWLAQEAAIELHPWTSRTSAPDMPTYALIDIDPGEETSWQDVLVLARLYRTALEHLGVIGLPKVTGKRGIQVWVPVRSGYSFEETRDWVEGVSRVVGQTVPELVSWEWAKRARRGRARLDYTQNAINKTLVAPYSPRPAAGAPVSAPIRWDELDDPDLAPDRWTIRSLPARLAQVGDLFAAALTTEQALPPL
jgi:bifunctional non-homologous end joining protein LigD